METWASSSTKKVIIGGGQPTVLIGERINPAGKKKLAEALKVGNLDVIGNDAIAQVQAGADIIDVNVATFGVDELVMLPRVLQVVMDAVDVPLSIDSNNPKALEASLKVYKGKPIINSVTGEEHSLKNVLPLVKEYEATVIGLVQDDEGIPNNSTRRVAVARKIIEQADKMGIPRHDIIIDCLASAVGPDPSAGIVAIETARHIRSEMGVNLTIGASNISFGLPNRDILNCAFVATVIVAGVTSLIVDVAKVRPFVLAADLALGNDKRARRYIEAYRQSNKNCG